MNWTTYEVSEHQFRNLVNYGEPIPVPSRTLVNNCGVEVVSLGNRLNAIYDGNKGAIRKLNTSNPQFTNMPNRDIILYNDHLTNDSINTIVANGFYGK